MHALVPLLLAALGPQRSGRSDSPGPALVRENLGLAVGVASPVVAGRVLVEGNELQQGVDLNGDGDVDDMVQHVVSRQGGPPSNLGLAGFAFTGPVLAQSFDGNVPLSISERAQGGVDLNHDGDALDLVWHAVNVETLRLLNLEMTQAFPFGSEKQAFLNTWEASERRDLNGDGDQDDREAFRLDLATGARTLIGTGRVVQIPDGRLLLVEREWETLDDANGDGDTNDEFVFLHDVSSGALDPLPVLNTRNLHWNVAGHTLFSTPSERDLGLDLNGDGDRRDRVLQAFDLDLRRSFNLGRTSTSGLFARGPWILGSLLESSAGRDWNGDGDTDDSLLHTYDEERHASSLHAFEWRTAAGSLPNEDLLLATRSEAGLDANGDGDGIDEVPVLYDLRQRAEKRLPFALARGRFSLTPIQVVGDRMSFLVDEGAQGADLNADGDEEDLVLEVYFTNTLQTWSSGLAVDLVDLGDEEPWLLWSGPRCVALAVSEASQGGQDLNGDGDLADVVLHVLALSPSGRNTLTNLGITAFRNPFVLEPLVREHWIGLQPQRDLDGRDDVLPTHIPFFHHLESGTTLSLGTAGEILAMSDDHALVRVLEEPLGDLNGDGDALDLVLQRITLVGP